MQIPCRSVGRWHSCTSRAVCRCRAFGGGVSAIDRRSSMAASANEGECRVQGHNGNKEEVSRQQDRNHCSQTGNGFKTREGKERRDCDKSKGCKQDGLQGFGGKKRRTGAAFKQTREAETDSADNLIQKPECRRQKNRIDWIADVRMRKTE